MGAAFTPTRTVVTVRRFQNMVAAGVWRDDERIELIDGDLFDMAPMGGPHAWAVTRAADLLRGAVSQGVVVWVQLPVVLGDRSQPQPDLALIREREGGYGDALPGAADVLLLVEVSDTTIDYDRGTKLRLYAAHAIPEYWIIDLSGKRVEVYRRPEPCGYAEHRAFGSEETLTMASLPGIVVSVRALLGG